MTKTLAVLVASLAILATACRGGGAGGPAATTTASQAAASASPTARPCCTTVPAAYSNIATRAALKAAGIDPDKDVDMITVASHANRTQALLAGTIDAGVDDPPEDLELVKAGLNPIVDLASQKLPAANTGVIMQRTYLNANRDTVQAYVDSLTIARLKMKSDKAGAVAVLGKYFKLDNQDALNNAYDFFMNEVTVPYLYPEVNQFKDAVEILGKINEKVKTVDIAKMLDRSFMQSAQDRKLGG